MFISEIDCSTYVEPYRRSEGGSGSETVEGTLKILQREPVIATINKRGALTEAVSQGKFKAVIDVFPREPLPKDHPIRKAPGVVLSAHRAGSVAHQAESCHACEGSSGARWQEPHYAPGLGRIGH